ncbi:hypothetical protein ACOMHN_058999 [Nucella lapillus]
MSDQECGSASEEEEQQNDTSDESVVHSDSGESSEGSSSDDDGAAGDAGDAGDSDNDDPANNIHGVWMPIIGEDPGPAPIPFTAVPGPIHPPPAAARPIEYVDLFFTPDFVHAVVEETNIYSQQWVDGHQDYLRQKPTSIVHQWIKKGPTTPEEFRAFLGVSLNMGLIRKATINSYWDTSHPSQRTPWFNDHFSRDQFKLLMKFLHFSNNVNQPAADAPAFKLYKIQPLIDHFNRSFLHCYHPGVDVAIDESMVGFKGKTPHLRQYMPQKRHARFGIKLWCVCDSTNGYTSLFEVFKGRNPAANAEPHGMTYALVMRLLTACDFLHRGHHLAVDNYFSSPELFLDLYTQGTTATGTVRTHRRGLPRGAVNQRLQNHHVAERRKGPLLCVAYKDGTKKPVLLSTATSAGFMAVNNRRRQQVQKPKCVLKYNHTMGGVDMSDARLYTYLSERRTMKWTLKVAFSLFGRAVLNSYIIYRENTSDAMKLTRYQFMIQVVEGLAGNYFPPKVVCGRRTAAEIQAARNNPVLQVPAAPQPQPQPGPAGDGHQLRKLPVGRRRNCVVGHDRRVRTSWVCVACDVGLCPQCFTAYHRRPRQ